MMRDPDIFRAAQLLIDGRGQSAAPHANRRSKELLLRGYVEASGLWDEVVAAIEDLQSDGRDRESLN